LGVCQQHARETAETWRVSVMWGLLIVAFIAGGLFAEMLDFLLRDK
jgi:hypothetical protein